MVTVPGESCESFDEESTATVAVSRIVMTRRHFRCATARVRLLSDDSAKQRPCEHLASEPPLTTIAPHGRPDNTRGDPAA
ncbi:MAG: hypothetical protein KDA93_25515 [Planctomycetaceae bacterium]|nr:hypothetical protein [Planctomycetaceae bacterium]